MLYPLGFFGFLFLNTLFNQWVVFAHGSAGPLLLAGYAAQGLASPFWGHLGDRAAARWGGRRRLTLLAAPLLLAAFAGALTAGAPVVLVLVYCLLFGVALQPYLALIPSLAKTDEARARAMSLGSVFALGAAAAALVAGPLLIERGGLGALATVGAVVFALTSCVAAFGVREGKAETAAGLPPGRLWAELKRALGQAPVRRFVLGASLLTATQMALVVSGPWVAGTLLHRGQSATAVLNGVLVVGLLGSVGLLARIGKRYRPLSLLRAGAIVAALALAVLGATTALPQGPLADGLCGACFLALGFVALTVVALPPLAAAKLADEDGRGLPGIFFGLGGTANGLGNALGALAASSLVRTGGVFGLRATIVLAGASALLAAVVLRPGGDAGR